MNLALAAVACLSFLGQAQEKDKLREALKDSAVRGDWIYDDLDAGYVSAKKSGKPMLIVFR
jgi:hypothetical protein